MKGLIQEIQYLPNRTSRGGKRKYMKWIKTPTEENYPEDMNFQTEKVHQVLKTMEWNRDPSQGTLSWHVRTQGIKRQFLKSFQSRDRTHKKVWIRMHIRHAKKKSYVYHYLSKLLKKVLCQYKRKTEETQDSGKGARGSDAEKNNSIIQSLTPRKATKLYKQKQYSGWLRCKYLRSYNKVSTMYLTIN